MNHNELFHSPHLCLSLCYMTYLAYDTKQGNGVKTWSNLAKIWTTSLFDVFLFTNIRLLFLFLFSACSFQTLAVCKSLCLIQPCQYWWWLKKARLSASAVVDQSVLLSKIVYPKQRSPWWQQQCSPDRLTQGVNVLKKIDCSTFAEKRLKTRWNKHGFSFASCKFLSTEHHRIPTQTNLFWKGKKSCHKLLKTWESWLSGEIGCALSF